MSRSAFALLAALACCGAPTATPAAAPVATQAVAGFAWPNLTDFLTQLIGRVGPPIKVYRLVIDRDSRVELLIQDQAQPDHIDRWDYEAGQMQGPAPVKFRNYPSQAALDHHVIELLEVDFPRLPAMLEAARTRLKLPDATVVEIRLERGDSGGLIQVTGEAIWTFKLETPRHDGKVEFDLHGRVLHVAKD